MSSEAPPTDPVADAAAIEAKAAKELKKKKKMQARQEEMRRKVLEDAKLKAAARIAKDTDKANDDDDDDEAGGALSEEHVAWLAELKDLTGGGRKPDSFPMPTGITRRLTPFDYAFYLNAIMGKSDEEKKEIVSKMNNPSHVSSELAEMRQTAMETFKKKAYKGKSGASLEAKIAKNESRARKLYKTVVKQFVVLKRSAATVLTNLGEAVEYMRIGLFELDRGDDVSKDTFLHAACREGEWDVAQWLLAHGADPNAENDRGETPLYLAAGTLAAGDERSAGAYECIWGVLERGGDARIKTSDGKTANDVCVAMGPPLELDAISNLLLLRVRSRGDWERHFSWWQRGEGDWTVSGVMPQPQVLKLAMKDYRMRKMQEQQARLLEEEKARAEAELAAQRAEEEKVRAKKEKLEMRKKGKIIWVTATEHLRSMYITAAAEQPEPLSWLGTARADLGPLDEDYDDVSNEYKLVRLICDPNLTKMFHSKAIDASAPLNFIPASALELAAASEHALAVGALLGCGADPNVYREVPDQPGAAPMPLLLRVLQRLDALVAAGEALDGERARLLVEISTRLIEAGAATVLVQAPADAAPVDADADTPPAAWVAASDAESVAHVRTTLQSAAVVDWVDRQYNDGDHQQPYNDSKRRRVLAAMLVLIQAYEENEKRNIQDAQSRLKDKKRRARELAKRQAELTAQLQQSTADAQEQANQDVESLAKQLAEQEERARQEALEAESLLQARLARGKKDSDQSNMYDKAMKLAALQFAQNESEEAQAAAAMAAKLQSKKRKTKEEREEEERVRAEGEELLRQQQTEKEELQEDLEPAGLLDASLFSAFTMMDLSEAVSVDKVAQLYPELTRPTVKAVEALLWEFKHHRESHKGLDGRVLESLLELGYDHKSGVGAWAGVKALDEMLDASIAERKILRKFQSQGSSFSKKALREIGRRLATLDVNARIYEDLLRRVYVLHPTALAGEVAAAEAGREWAAMETQIRDIMARRDEEELALGYALFSPALDTIHKGILSKDLLKVAAPLLVSLENAFESVHPDDQDELPIDLGLRTRLLDAPPLWALEGYLQRQLAWTDGSLRGLRENKLACQAQLSTVTAQGPREEVELMVGRLTDQMAPLDVQRDMYGQLLAQIHEYQQKAYPKLSPADQALWTRCWAKHEEDVKVAVAQQEAQRVQATLQEQEAGQSKMDLLLARVQAVHGDDWLRPAVVAGKEIQTSAAQVGAVQDDDLDGNWMATRNMEGIDQDLVDDLSVLTEPQALRYLAIKLAENEGHHAFLRKYQQHTPEPTEDIAAYESWLDRRYPMLQHLYHALVRDMQAVPDSVPMQLVPYDESTRTRMQQHLFPLQSELLLDLQQQRLGAAKVLLAVCVHDATMVAYDWSALREQVASEQWVQALSRLQQGALRGHASGSGGGIHTAAYGAAPVLPLPLPTPAAPSGAQLSSAGATQMVRTLHCQLHGECTLSEDVVEMVLSEHPGGVTASSLVPVLHDLHVACVRAAHVFWDAQVLQPAPTLHPTATHAQWGMWPVSRPRVLAPAHAALVYQTNDLDLRAHAYDRFLARVQAQRRKHAKDLAHEFPMSAIELPLPRALWADADAQDQARDPAAPLPVLPVLGSTGDAHGRRDVYADEVRYGLHMPDRRERVGVGYWDLRDELVVAPQRMRYAPSGW